MDNDISMSNKNLFIEREENRMEEETKFSPNPNEEEINQFEVIKEMVFNWIKKHKRDIIVAGGSALITAYVYHKYGVKISQDSIRIRFEGDHNVKNVSKEYLLIGGYTTTTFNNCSIKDLGKIGKELIKRYPGIITEKSVINRASVDYDIYKKRK